MLFPVLALMDRLPLGKQRNLSTSSCPCVPPLSAALFLVRWASLMGKLLGGQAESLPPPQQGCPLVELSTPLAFAGEVEVSEAIRS